MHIAHITSIGPLCTHTDSTKPLLLGVPGALLTAARGEHGTGRSRNGAKAGALGLAPGLVGSQDGDAWEILAEDEDGTQDDDLVWSVEGVRRPVERGTWERYPLEGTDASTSIGNRMYLMYLPSAQSTIGDAPCLALPALSINTGKSISDLPHSDLPAVILPCLASPYRTCVLTLLSSRCTLSW
ncbi:hypothetical protein CKAH01_07208 [Colletotrichum kahawae]|uniref:Uncharacterized protein n=1 Tax=Colletotrichum kahawae TaxID=34407 RepID=A0AAE0D1B5_COLKA|nr:hypothetical protein CKAH01_07208 [Colletotrichum kahawae]